MAEQQRPGVSGGSVSPGMGSSPGMGGGSPGIGGGPTAGGELASRSPGQGQGNASGDTGNTLRGDDKAAAIEGYVTSAATQVDRFSTYVRSTSVREMVNNLERFARQQPTLFVGGAFMLGLLGARFLKSSSESTSSPEPSLSSGGLETRRDLRTSSVGRSESSATASGKAG